MSRTRLRLSVYLCAAVVAAGGGIAVAAAADDAAPSPLAAGLSVAPYIDMGLSGRPRLADFATAGGVRAYSLAFITSPVGCRASWFNAFDPREGAFSDEIDELRQQGGDVVVSFGGASGRELATACTDVEELTAEYQAVVDAYDLKVIDLDIEGASIADRASVERRSAAIAALQAANPGLQVSLTLPVLPEGLTADGLSVVQSARDAGVDVALVNVMAMDYGRAGQDYGDLAIDAAKSTADQLGDIFTDRSSAEIFATVGVTPMLGVNDDQGVFDQDDARGLVTFANDTGIGYLSFWEANRDRNACIGALFQCTNIEQEPFEFSRIIGAF